MVWQILHGVQLDVQESLLTRSPFLEMDSLQGTKKTTKAMARHNLEAAAAMKGPRVIKTHLPIDMLPKDVLTKAKVVFVARNPMDCCVSFFHHERLVPNQGFLGTFEQYANLFRNGRNPMGDYWYHLKVRIEIYFQDFWKTSEWKNALREKFSFTKVCSISAEKCWNWIILSKKVKTEKLKLFLFWIFFGFQKFPFLTQLFHKGCLKLPFTIYS